MTDFSTISTEVSTATTYHLKKQLGKGSFSNVFEAINKKGDKVAIKVISKNKLPYDLTSLLVKK